MKKKDVAMVSEILTTQILDTHFEPNREKRELSTYNTPLSSHGMFGTTNSVNGTTTHFQNNVQHLQAGGDKHYIVSIDSSQFKKMNKGLRTLLNEKMNEYSKMVSCLEEKTKFVTVDGESILSELVFVDSAVAQELRNITENIFIEVMLSEIKFQQNNIDIPYIFEKWANIWTKECNPHAQFHKIFYRGDHEEWESLSKSAKERIQKELKIIQPQAKSGMSIRLLDTTPIVELKETKNISLVHKINATSIPVGLSKEGNIFTFNGVISQKEKIFINNVLQIKGNYDFPIAISPVNKKGIHLNNAVSIYSKNESLNLKTKLTANKNCITIEEKTNQYKFNLEAELTGYVIVIVKGRKINPGKNYTKLGTAHKEWLIPVSKIFQDLDNYIKNKKIQNDLKSIIDQFKIDSKENKVIYQTSCIHELIKETNLQCDSMEELSKEFNEKLNSTKVYLTNYYMRQLRLHRLFYNPLPLKNYYIELSIQNKGNSIKINSIDDLLFQESDHSINRHLLILGDAGIGKTTLAMYLLQQWARNKLMKNCDWVFYLSFNNINCINYPNNGEIYTLAKVITNECFSADIFPFIDTLKQSHFWLDEINQLLKSKKALVLLDSLDEQDISPHLKPIINELFALPHLVCFSRRTPGNNLPNRYEFDPSLIVTIDGFFSGKSHKNIYKYIENFFESIPNSGNNKDEKLKIYLSNNQDNNNPLLDICRTPIHCEMICTSWDRGYQNITNIADLYHAIISMVLISYLEKFPDKLSPSNIREATYKNLLGYCRKELGTLELISFLACLEGEVSCRNDYSYYIRRYMRQDVNDTNIQEIFKEQIQLGFIKYDSRKSFPYSFVHSVFRDFFAARYLLSCLQKLTSKSTQKRISSYSHQWISIEDIQKIGHTSYNGKNAEDFLEYIIASNVAVSFKGCIEFLEILLASNKCINVSDKMKNNLSDFKKALTNSFPVNLNPTNKKSEPVLSIKPDAKSLPSSPDTFSSMRIFGRKNTHHYVNNEKNILSNLTLKK